MGSICMLSLSYMPYMSRHLEGDSTMAPLRLALSLGGMWTVQVHPSIFCPWITGTQGREVAGAYPTYLRAKAGYTPDKQEDRDRIYRESVQIPHRKARARLKPMSFLLCGDTTSRCTTVAPLGTVWHLNFSVLLWNLLEKLTTRFLLWFDNKIKLIITSACKFVLPLSSACNGRRILCTFYSPLTSRRPFFFFFAIVAAAGLFCVLLLYALSSCLPLRAGAGVCSPG